MSPRSFREAILAFPNYRSLSQWLGLSKHSVEEMARKNCISGKHWLPLIAGLKAECGVEVTSSDIAAWPNAKPPKERMGDLRLDWSRLPETQTIIFRHLRIKRVPHDLAQEASDHAVLSMLENGKTARGFGVVCAWNYVRNKKKLERVRGHHVDIYSEAAAQNLSLITKPNQEARVEIDQISRFASRLGGKYLRVFQCLLSEMDDAEMAETIGCQHRAIHSYKSELRRLLRERIAA